MDPRNFLQVADELAQAGGPAHNRSAISRGYYAAYNVAVEFLADFGFTMPRSGEAHRDVQDRLANGVVSDIKAAGAQLGTLLTNRIRADYRMQDPFAERDANVDLSLRLAAQVIRWLDQAAADPNVRARVTTAIRAWERRGRR